MKSVTVKVQAPLYTNAPADEADILVYDRGRVHTAMMFPTDLPPWLRAELEKTPKLFAKAMWLGGTWVISGRAGWQSW